MNNGNSAKASLGELGSSLGPEEETGRERMSVSAAAGLFMGALLALAALL